MLLQRSGHAVDVAKSGAQCLSLPVPLENRRRVARHLHARHFWLRARPRQICLYRKTLAWRLLPFRPMPIPNMPNCRWRPAATTTWPSRPARLRSRARDGPRGRASTPRGRTRRCVRPVEATHFIRTPRRRNSSSFFSSSSLKPQASSLSPLALSRQRLAYFCRLPNAPILRLSRYSLVRRGVESVGRKRSAAQMVPRAGRRASARVADELGNDGRSSHGPFRQRGGALKSSINAGPLYLIGSCPLRPPITTNP